MSKSVKVDVKYIDNSSDISSILNFVLSFLDIDIWIEFKKDL
jgi:hypothetical protein